MPAEPPTIFSTRASRCCLRLQGKGGVIQSLSTRTQAGPSAFLALGLLATRAARRAAPASCLCRQAAPNYPSGETAERIAACLAPREDH
jgi:hypothetical protein